MTPAIEVSIDVTYKCPFACAFCSSHGTDAPLAMSESVATRVGCFLRRLSGQSEMRLCASLTGGEPLCDPDGLLKMLAIWNMSADITVCTTAAVGLNARLWATLADAGVRTVRISIHSARSDNLASIFGNSYSMSTIIDNLRHIQDAGIVAHANYVVTTGTLHEASDVVDFCCRHGIQRLRVLGLARQGRAAQNWKLLKPTVEQEHTLLAGIAAICRAANLQADFAGFPGVRNCTHADMDGHCLGGTRFFHIATDGSVYPCPAVKSLPDRSLGMLDVRGLIPVATASARPSMCAVEAI